MIHCGDGVPSAKYPWLILNFLWCLKQNSSEMFMLWDSQSLCELQTGLLFLCLLDLLHFSDTFHAKASDGQTHGQWPLTSVFLSDECSSYLVCEFYSALPPRLLDHLDPSCSGSRCFYNQTEGFRSSRHLTNAGWKPCNVLSRSRWLTKICFNLKD